MKKLSKVCLFILFYVFNFSKSEENTFISISAFLTYSIDSHNLTNLSFTFYNQKENMINHFQTYSKNLILFGNINDYIISYEKGNNIFIIQNLEEFKELLLNNILSENSIFIASLNDENKFFKLNLNQTKIILIENNYFEKLLNQTNLVSSVSIYFHLSQTKLFPFNLYIFFSIFTGLIYFCVLLNKSKYHYANLFYDSLIKILCDSMIFSSFFFMVYVILQNYYLSFGCFLLLYNLCYYLKDISIIVSKFLIFLFQIKFFYGEKFLNQNTCINMYYSLFLTFLELCLKYILGDIKIIYPSIIIMECLFMFIVSLYYFLKNIKKILCLYNIKKFIKHKNNNSLIKFFSDIIRFKIIIMTKIGILMFLYIYFTILFTLFYYLFLLDYKENILFVFFLIEWSIIILLINCIFSGHKYIYWNLGIKEISQLYSIYMKQNFKIIVNYKTQNNWESIENTIKFKFPIIIISPFIHRKEYLFDNIKVGYFE